MLREGKPGDPFGAAPVWESGRVDPKKVRWVGDRYGLKRS